MAFAWREAHPNPPTPGAPSFAHFAKGGRPRTPTHRRLKSRSPFLSLPSRKQPSKEAPNNALKNSCEPPIPPPSTAFLAPFRRIAGRLLTFYQAPSHVAPQVDISPCFKPREVPLFLTAGGPPSVCFPAPTTNPGPILRAFCEGWETTNPGPTESKIHVNPKCTLTLIGGTLL